MRRLPDPMSRLSITDDAAHRLGGAVPSPAAAFLLALIALPALFWLITLKRTTVTTLPEEWLMANVVAPVHRWGDSFPPLDAAMRVVSALGSGWFVALGFAALGLLALARHRRDLALLLALGTLAFPMEWALKYFTSAEVLTLPQLVGAMFDVGGIGLDDITDFPAGHALRASAFYGLAAFCVARLAHDVRQGLVAYGVAAVLILAISATRLYLEAHFPIDLLGGWMAGGSLVAILVAIHVLGVDERMRVAGTRAAEVPPGGRRVAVPRRPAPAPAPTAQSTTQIEG